ncbi:MAG TPA: polysaccharide pyruvyl transferase CsaB [Bacillales bacterium]
MKVVISGYYGFGNAGDEAILYALIQALRAYDPCIQITVLSDKPEQTEAVYGVKAVSRWRLIKILRALRVSDGLLSGGGGLLQDETGWKSVFYYTSIMAFARLLGKPFVVFAQGVGPMRYGFNRKLAKSVLSMASWVSVRDEGSRELLKEIGIDKEMKVVPDPAIALGEGLKVVKSEGVPTVVVSVRWWSSRNNFKKKVASALDRCARQGYRIVFLPMHGKEDQSASEEVLTLMKEPASITSCDASFEEKLRLVGQADVVFGMRLHSLIFAAVNRVPFVALSYDPKVDAFTNQCCQPLLGSVDDLWGEKDLYDQIVHQVNHGHLESARLDTLISHLKEDIYSAAQQALAVMNTTFQKRIRPF